MAGKNQLKANDCGERSQTIRIWRGFDGVEELHITDVVQVDLVFEYDYQALPIEPYSKYGCRKRKLDYRRLSLQLDVVSLAHTRAAPQYVGMKLAIHGLLHCRTTIQEDSDVPLYSLFVAVSAIESGRPRMLRRAFPGGRCHPVLSRNIWRRARWCICGSLSR